jgi:hypothetical protein
MNATRERSKGKKGSKKSQGTKPEAVVEEPTLADRERKHYQEIQQLGKECELLESDFKDKKATASAAKSAWESAVSVLQATIRRGPDPQLELPLRVDWLATPVGEAIELTEKQAEKLAELGIRTVGQLDEIRVGAGLETLPGIGRAIADKWEDQLLDWIAANAPKESDTTGDEDSDSDEDEGGDE